MRWRFPDPNDGPETELRTAIQLRMDRFWQQFATHAPDIVAKFSGHSELDLAEFMHEHLSAVHPGLMWEFGPPFRGGEQRLVITPESERQLRPLVDELLARAPALSAWEFYTHRLPEPFDEAVGTVHGRTEVEIGKWQVQANRAPHHLLDLKWLAPFGTTGDNLQHAAFVASEALLGEEVLDTWIGEIAVEEQPRQRSFSRIFGRATGADERPESLLQRVNALIADIDGELEDTPQSDVDHDQVEHTLFSLEPKEADDYPRRRDLFVSASAGLASVWQAAHSQFMFASRRFSRHGEIFCYVKMDGRDSADHADVQARAKIEDALNAVLRPAGIGAVVGGGTGRRYSYIDLAIRHLDHGVSEVRRVLRQVGVPERSWLLFFDAHLADEWIGIYDHTPPPPTGAD